MKIKLALMHRDGEVVFHEVKATLPFQVFGYTFAAHPAVNPDGSFKDPKKSGWVVSEASSGAMAGHGNTRREVIEFVKETVKSVGADRVRMSIELQLSLLADRRSLVA